MDEKAFLSEAFEAKPESTSLEDLQRKHNFVVKSKLGGGKSGAAVYLSQDSKRVIKIYSRRDKSGTKKVGTTRRTRSGFYQGFKTKETFDDDLRSLFQSGTIKEKRDAYIARLAGLKKKDKSTFGDSDLYYIRSVRDIYINIVLNRKARLREQRISPEVLDYGFIESGPSFQPYLVTENLKSSGYKEMLESYYGGKPKDVLFLKRLLQALRRKHEIFKDAEQHFIGCHRDLHPGNIFYKESNGDFKIKLIDFDLSITDSDILNRVKDCDRRTMQRSDKKNLGFKQVAPQVNATTALFTLRKGLKLTFYRLYRNDADLYQFMSYYYLFKAQSKDTFIRKQLERLDMNIQEEVKQYNDLYEQKEYFFKAMLRGLDEIIVRKAPIRRRSTMLFDEPLKF